METTPDSGVSQAPSLESRFDTYMTDAKPEPKAEPKAEPKPEPKAQSDVEVTSEQEPLEVESEPKEAPGGVVEGENVPTVQSIAELAKELDTTPDELYNLKVPVKVDGKETEITLKDVIKSYQIESHVNNKSIEVSNKLKEIETERQQFIQGATQQLQMISSLAEAGRQQIMNEFRNVDWATLQATDPVEYATKRIAYQDRESQLAAYLNQVQQQSQQLASQAQQQTQAKVAAEMQVLTEQMPTWANEDTRKKDFAAITNYLREVGFTNDDINTIVDHRIVVAAHDAARYRALIAAKPLVNKQVRAAPKQVKPGVRVERGKPDALKEAAKRLRKTHNNADGAAAFAEYAEREGWT